jgi:hypothetical protein
VHYVLLTDRNPPHLPAGSQDRGRRLLSEQHSFFAVGICPGAIYFAGFLGLFPARDVFEHIMWAEMPTRISLILVIAVATTEDVRVAREPDIRHPSPRLLAVSSKSVNLARMILGRVGRS